MPTDEDNASPTDETNPVDIISNPELPDDELLSAEQALNELNNLLNIEDPSPILTVTAPDFSEVTSAVKLYTLEKAAYNELAEKYPSALESDSGDDMLEHPKSLERSMEDEPISNSKKKVIVRDIYSYMEQILDTVNTISTDVQKLSTKVDNMGEKIRVLESDQRDLVITSTMSGKDINILKEHVSSVKGCLDLQTINLSKVNEQFQNLSHHLKSPTFSAKPIDGRKFEGKHKDLGKIPLVVKRVALPGPIENLMNHPGLEKVLILDSTQVLQLKELMEKKDLSFWEANIKNIYPNLTMEDSDVRHLYEMDLTAAGANQEFLAILRSLKDLNLSCADREPVSVGLTNILPKENTTEEKQKSQIRSRSGNKKKKMLTAEDCL